MKFLSAKEKLINRVTAKAICDYGMIAHKDRVLVGVSGTDSLALLHILQQRQRVAPIDFKLIAVHVNLNDKNAAVIERYLKKKDIEYHIVKCDLKSASRGIKKSKCFWCSWKRRETIFKMSKQLNCRKVALAHHADDIIETFLLNLFFHSQLSTMPPKLKMFKGRFYIIRPFCYLEKKLIDEYSSSTGIPKMPYECPYGLRTNRVFIRKIIKQIEKKSPHVKKNIYRSMVDIRRAYLPKI